MLPAPRPGPPSRPRPHVCPAPPSDGVARIKDAIAFARPLRTDAFVAVGGGSVIDTAKLMNLYAAYPDADFLDFVNAPLGRGLPITRRLAPLIAVPTTAGTGSETTGTAVFDLAARRTKTGIAHRNLRPSLGLCDPLNTRSMPPAVRASSGLDVLCHALESWTAIPYTDRVPRPPNPLLRPAYQGANPISDVFALSAMRSTIEYLPRAVRDPDDAEAQSQMLLASTLAGVGFGNAGVHLCHGMPLTLFTFPVGPLLYTISFLRPTPHVQRVDALPGSQACRTRSRARTRATSTRGTRWPSR